MVVRREAIVSRYPGSWDGFVADAPNKTLASASRRSVMYRRGHDDCPAVRSSGMLCRTFVRSHPQEYPVTASARKRGTTTADLIVDGLKSFLRDIRQNPSATIVELRVGRPASKEILKRALDRAHMPLELLQLASRMSGFTLEWTSRPRRRQRQLGGGVDVPTLARQLKGWDDLAFNEHPDSDIGVCVVDVAPATSDGLFACYADGDLGVWHQNDDTFHVEGFGLEEYFEAGIRNLFVPGWLSHVLEEGFDSIAPDAIEARELLNIPLPQPENDSAPANLQVESFSKIDWLPLPSGAHQGQTLPQAFMEDPAYVLKAARAGDFRGALHDQTLKVCERARRVRVPPKGEKCVVVYYLDAAGNYDKQSIVDADYPRRWPEPNAVTLTSNCIDLTMAMRIAPRDSSAPIGHHRVAEVQGFRGLTSADARVLRRVFQYPGELLRAAASRPAGPRACVPAEGNPLPLHERTQPRGPPPRTAGRHGGRGAEVGFRTGGDGVLPHERSCHRGRLRGRKTQPARQRR